MLVSFPGRNTSEASEAPELPGTQPRRVRRRAVLQRDNTHASLRLPATSLVGRVSELAHIEACLRLDGTGIRLLSLVGSPGTGKTRLSLEAAVRLADGFEQGVYFVDLSTATDAEVVPAAIAHVLGATYTGRRQVSVADTLKRVLRGRDVLLVLDNFEGVLAAGPMLEDLLVACPRSTCRCGARSGDMPVEQPTRLDFVVSRSVLQTSDFTQSVLDPVTEWAERRV
jgi:hypothetical protein